MHWRGFRNLCTFYLCWLGGSFLIPLALLCLCFRVLTPLVIVIGYYSFRFIFPAKRSEYIRQYFLSDDTPYCRSSKYFSFFFACLSVIPISSSPSRILFDDGATAPKPYSKTLLSVAPHGILTLGWSFCISSRSFYDSEVKWLVAPAMMKLPFVSDVMK
jgi:hypothetical protein